MPDCKQNRKKRQLKDKRKKKNELIVFLKTCTTRRRRIWNVIVVCETAWQHSAADHERLVDVFPNFSRFSTVDVSYLTLTQVVRVEGCLRLQNPCLANFLDYRTLPHWFTETEIEPGYRFTTSRRIVFDHNVFTLLGLLKALFRLRKAPLLNPSLLYWTRRNIPHWSKYRIATYFCLSSCLCCIQWCWLFQNGWIQNFAVTLMADGISWSHQQHT